MYPSKIHIITAILMFSVNLSSEVQAQDEVQINMLNELPTAKMIEARTYSLYLKNDWKALVAAGDSALEQGVDYYYLRSRMGVAYFSLGKYFTAIKHLKAAVGFNPVEEFPVRYLSLSYLYTGQYEKSRKIALKLSAHSQGLILFDSKKIFNYIGFNPGFKFSNSEDVPTANLLSFNVGHYLFKTVSFNHNFSTYNQQAEYWDFGQKDYFVQGNIPVGQEYLLSLSYHYLYGTSLINFETYQQKYNTQAYAASAIISKQIGKHNFAIGTTGLEIDSVFQMQHDASYTFYPLDNTKLSLGIKGYFHTADFYSTNYFSALPFVSLQATKKLGLFTSYLNSRGNNIAEWNGSILNNSPDLTTSKITLGLNYQLAKQWQIATAFEREQKTSESIDDYRYNSFYLSLKYTPL